MADQQREKSWSARYVSLLATELAARGVQYPDEMLAAFIDGNVTTVAAIAGISERDAQLTINADAVPAWADMVAGMTIECADVDVAEASWVRISMATAAKTTAALAQCHEMIVHSIETEQELASEDEATADTLTVLVAQGDTISRLSRHLAIVIAETAFTAGDVLVEEDFYEAVLEVLTDIIEGDDAEIHDQLLPGWYCQAWHDPNPFAGPWESCGNPAHSLTGILAAAVTELQDTHIHVE
ncbi:hypothetical protein [Rhodococcus sp. T7]|uniref:hypothetical protein n=1 Tax=Rhodococcus sp. T7 TaxID=627444 RepID=UPI001359D2EC|nr:hypothetical protein [Rhodococcus sp. T7]KAF0956904.1 hypothetical protein MLGJGCBP_09984 [Rhodococcus sp. T7]KAF0958672.1 hypothetical protein MLGJGCBP_08244 [Rhodococcus sp. T7]